MLTLGATLLVTLMATAFVLISLFMILVILIQKPKGGGLSGAFGGAGGSSQAAFGAKTGDLLTLITTGCFVTFLLLAGGLTFAIRADVKPKDDAPPPTESVAVPVQDVAQETGEPSSEQIVEQTQPVIEPTEQLPEQAVTPAAQTPQTPAEPTTSDDQP